MKTFLHTFLLTLGALTSMTSFVQAAAARPKAIPTVSLPMPAFTLSFDKIKGAAGAESLVGMTHVLKQEPMIAQLPSTLTQKSGSFTLSLWTKFNGIYGTQRLLDQDGQAPSRFALQLGGAHHRFAFAVLGADTQAESDFAPTPGQWYHISGVYDAPAKQIRLYADGTPLATAPVSAPVVPQRADSCRARHGRSYRRSVRLLTRPVRRPDCGPAPAGFGSLPAGYVFLG